MSEYAIKPLDASTWDAFERLAEKGHFREHSPGPGSTPPGMPSTWAAWADVEERAPLQGPFPGSTSLYPRWL